MHLSHLLCKKNLISFLAKTCEIPKDVLNKKVEPRALKIPTRTIVHRRCAAIKSYTYLKLNFYVVYNFLAGIFHLNHPLQIKMNIKITNLLQGIYCTDGQVERQANLQIIYNYKESVLKNVFPPPSCKSFAKGKC